MSRLLDLQRASSRLLSTAAAAVAPKPSVATTSATALHRISRQQSKSASMPTSALANGASRSERLNSHRSRLATAPVGPTAPIPAVATRSRIISFEESGTSAARTSATAQYRRNRVPSAHTGPSVANLASTSIHRNMRGNVSKKISHTQSNLSTAEISLLEQTASTAPSTIANTATPRSSSLPVLLGVVAAGATVYAAYVAGLTSFTEAPVVVEKSVPQVANPNQPLWLQRDRA